MTSTEMTRSILGETHSLYIADIIFRERERERDRVRGTMRFIEGATRKDDRQEM